MNLLPDLLKIIPKGYGWSIGEWNGSAIVSIWKIPANCKTIPCPTCKRVKFVGKESKFRDGIYIMRSSIDEAISDAIKEVLSLFLSPSAFETGYNEKDNSKEK